MAAPSWDKDYSKTPDWLISLLRRLTGRLTGKEANW